MKSLETHLGVRLFRRLNRRLELTDAGAAFLPAARSALDVVEASAARVVGGDTRRGPRWWSPACQTLHDALADSAALRLQCASSARSMCALSASSAPVDFARDGVDVAIRMGADRWPEGIEAHAFMNGEVSARSAAPRSPSGAKPSPARRPAASPALAAVPRRAPCLAGWLARSKTTTIDASKGQHFEHYRYLLTEAAVARSRRGTVAPRTAGDGGDLRRLAPPGRPVRLRAQRPAILPALHIHGKLAGVEAKSPHLPLLDRPEGAPPLTSWGADLEVRAPMKNSGQIDRNNG